MPRLPPVDMSPHTRLRARFACAVMRSTAILFQSHSSSSATSWARPVSVPCPISERTMRTTQVSSGLITTQALTSAPWALWAAPSALAIPLEGTLNPSARPPAAEPITKARRETRA
jgi:hypothetical protein